MTVKIEKEELVIRIGVKELAEATENAPGWYFETDEGDNRWEVTNQTAWGQTVVCALKNEKEDGTTLVHEMLDAAFEWGIEQGGEGVDATLQEAGDG